MSDCVVQVSDSALKQIAFLKEVEGNPNLLLRVYIMGGGCAGFQYGYAFEKTAKADDTLVDVSRMVEGKQLSIRVAIDPLSMMYLEGATVDYVETLMGRNFKIVNPNAATTCSCGSSFSIGGE